MMYVKRQDAWVSMDSGIIFLNLAFETLNTKFLLKFHKSSETNTFLKVMRLIINLLEVN